MSASGLAIVKHVNPVSSAPDGSTSEGSKKKATARIRRRTPLYSGWKETASTSSTPWRRTSGMEAASSVSENGINPVDYWRKEGHWPKQYFERKSNIDHLLAWKKSSSSLRRKQSDSGSTTPSSAMPSDQKPREEKSAPYRDARYSAWLETKGSFMDEDKEGPKKESKDLCQNLLVANQSRLEPCRIKFSTTYATFAILC
jgi:hypothetical protein